MAAKKQVVESPVPHYIACCFSGCPNSAIIRTRTKTGWANVCADHDKLLVQKSADEYCKARGLDTTEKKRKFVLETVRGMKRKFTPPDMVPEVDREAESIPF